MKRFAGGNNTPNRLFHTALYCWSYITAYTLQIDAFNNFNLFWVMPRDLDYMRSKRNFI